MQEAAMEGEAESNAAHEEPPLVAEVDPETGKYRCPKCSSKLFSTRASFNAHRITYHGSFRKTLGCPVGPSTCTKFQSMRALRVHLIAVHDIECVPEHYSFESKEDFLTWKDRIEESTSARFVRHCSYKSDGRQVWHCHRSKQRDEASHLTTAQKKERDEAKKPRRLRGSIKMDAYCPATISVSFNEDKSLEVTAYLKHVGHDNNTGRLPISNAARERARTLIQSCSQVDEVVETIRREAVPGDRDYTIRPDLVRQMRARDQQRINEMHNDANYLLVQPELITEVRPDQSWRVQSSAHCNQYFVVTKAKFGCPNEECLIRCDSCQVCPHLYSCPCPRRMRNTGHLPCMHIHAIHALRESLTNVGDEIGDQQGSVDVDAAHSEMSTFDKDDDLVVFNQEATVFKEVMEQATRVQSKIAAWKFLIETLSMDALQEASALSNQLEDLLNEAIIKAQSAQPALTSIAEENKKRNTSPPSDRATATSSSHVPLTNSRFMPPPAVKKTPEKPSIALARSTHSLGKNVRHLPSLGAMPHRLTTSNNAPIVAAQSSSPTSNSPRKRLMLLRLTRKPESSTDLPSAATRIILPRPLGSDRLKLVRQVQPNLRCVGCSRIVGSDNLSANKCVHCLRWCHNVCTHSCILEMDFE